MYIKTPRHIYHYFVFVPLFNSPPIRVSVIGAIFCGCRGNGDQHSKKLVTATQNANLTYHNPKTLYASLTPRAIFVIPDPMDVHSSPFHLEYLPPRRLISLCARPR